MYSLPIPQFPIQFQCDFLDCNSPLSKGTKNLGLLHENEFNENASLNSFNFDSEEEQLLYAKTAYNTPDKPAANYDQMIIFPNRGKCSGLASPVPEKSEKSEKPEKKAFVVSSKGRKMKRTDVMAALKMEYIKDANWSKEKK